MKISAEKILLSLIAFLASVGIKIAFDTNSLIKKMNDNLISVTFAANINNKEIVKLDDRLTVFQKSTITNHLQNRDKITENEKQIALVERWCRKWKAELDSLSQ